MCLGINQTYTVTPSLSSLSCTKAVGIRKMLEQLENSDEQADLATIEKRLAKIEQKMLSYADQRAEGTITPEQHRELVMRLQDEKDSLLEEKAKLTTKTERIKEALEMLAYVEPVARKMADKMKDLPLPGLSLVRLAHGIAKSRAGGNKANARRG